MIQDGNMVDEAILTMGKIYSYNISGGYFSTNVASIFAEQKWFGLILRYNISNRLKISRLRK